VVAFSTSGGSTSAFTTLIDGDSYQAGNASWIEPQALVVRPGNPGDGTPTLLVGQLGPGWSWVPILEFYLDTTAHPKDIMGNLQLRGDTAWAMWPWSGQLDGLTGSAWWGGLTGGMHELRSDDVRAFYELGQFYCDAASPVPEPGTLVLLGGSLLCMLVRQRKPQTY
jgi:hypothetical protein